jgi:hypothetical protein
MQREYVIKSILAEMDQFRSTRKYSDRETRQRNGRVRHITDDSVERSTLGTLHIILPYNKQTSQNIDKVTHFDHDG